MSNNHLFKRYSPLNLIGKNEESEDIGEFNNGNAFVEDDYDALNEETFASNFDDEEVGDWEQEHDQLLEIENSSFLNDTNTTTNNISNSNSKNNIISKTFSPNSLILNNSSANTTNYETNQSFVDLNDSPTKLLPSLAKVLPNVKTLEEIENELLNGTPTKPPPPPILAKTPTKREGGEEQQEQVELFKIFPQLATLGIGKQDVDEADSLEKSGFQSSGMLMESDLLANLEGRVPVNLEFNNLNASNRVELGNFPPQNQLFTNENSLNLMGFMYANKMMLDQRFHQHQQQRQQQQQQELQNNQLKAMLSNFQMQQQQQHQQQHLHQHQHMRLPNVQDNFLRNIDNNLNNQNNSPSSSMMKSRREEVMKSSPQQSFQQQLAKNGNRLGKDGRIIYADKLGGMMTEREKNWVVSVQMLQLQNDDPYSYDFYYTAWMLKKKNMNSKNSNISGLKTLLNQSSNKNDLKSYRPLTFENSLGKVTMSNFHHPRALIDVNSKSLDHIHLANTSLISQIEAIDEESDKHKEKKNLNTILLEIEQMYQLYLNVDEIEHRILKEPGEMR